MFTLWWRLCTSLCVRTWPECPPMLTDRDSLDGAAFLGGHWWIDLCMMIIFSNLKHFNSSPPSATYMHQWIMSALVQIMACRLYGTKPLSKPMLGYCPLGTNFGEILIKIQNFSFTKMHPKILSAEKQPFCPGGDELMPSSYILTTVKSLV